LIVLIWKRKIEVVMLDNIKDICRELRKYQKNIWGMTGIFLLVLILAVGLKADEIWEKLFPEQFSAYQKTKNMDFQSEENGNADIDMLQRDPRLVIIWAGSSFSKDYHQGRGHYYSVEDVKKSWRSEASQPMACWTCKSPQVLDKIKESGAQEFYKGKFSDGVKDIVQPVGCLDCHDSDTISLRSARPALEEALTRQGKDLNKASAQEKRALVCAQCHSEYYFKGQENYLTFPWDNGITVEAIEKYYDEIGFADWVHALSRVPMLKAQHPDYELYRQGTLAQLGLVCADCHMPAAADKKTKSSDHHIRSPLNNIAAACLQCHPEGEDAVRKHVYELQQSVKELRIKAEDILVQAHIEAKQAWDSGASEEEMKSILQLIRKAQWRWDFASASHGAAFHATNEVSRILKDSIVLGQQARTLLADVLVKRKAKVPVVMPDISTKEKAQAYIGLDMQKQIKEE
jgi:nitrite reductase (cytochrome c-552)